jgi:hypothetical protein
LRDFAVIITNLATIVYSLLRTVVFSEEVVQIGCNANTRTPRRNAMQNRQKKKEKALQRAKINESVAFLHLHCTTNPAVQVNSQCHK